MVDAVSQPRRLAEIRRRWMHDNNDLHQARITIQELMDEKYRLESQLQAAGLRERRFVSKKNKAEADLQRVTANLAEERVLWAHDIGEKDRVLSYAKAVQEELERKVVTEAQKAHLKEAESVLDQSNAEVDSLTSRLASLQGDRNWLITNGLVGAFEYLRQSESFVTLLDRLSTAAYQSGHHDGVYQGYFNYQQTDRTTPAFQENRGKLQAEIADALEAACNDPLPAYAELVDKVAEDGVDSLCQMLDMAEESGEE
ncbi:hypothetical protein HanXRQr2_Chr09g0407971 [Helianthus annuus]|uniref:Uncharacterized protein n=1 Tax=Helianthus annuus TaxID=4232 RepID=A0A9K3NA80_HELAN|nr:hypothetical protein HanXRQr2_Chr09g0407971 [Helianthus annuus]KAJ0536289.1 hypothetical protein HanIR_Chr09g0439881 [Helianthus annuus]KAJ0543956.1 hypothetical protein HanHA89_Chr09g0356231 [Helianthus annuus]